MSKAQSNSKEINDASKALLEKVKSVQQDLQVYMQNLKNTEATIRQRLAKEQKLHEEEEARAAAEAAARALQEKLAKEAEENAILLKAEQARAKEEEAAKKKAAKAAEKLAKTAAEQTATEQPAEQAPAQLPSEKVAEQIKEEKPQPTVQAPAEDKPQLNAQTPTSTQTPATEQKHDTGFRRPVQQGELRTSSGQPYQPGNAGSYQPRNDRPQGQGGYQGQRPQGQGYQGQQGGGYQGQRPPQGAGTGYQGQRPQGQGYQGQQGGGYQGQQGGGYQGQRPQGAGTGYQGQRPQGGGTGYQGQQRNSSQAGRLPLPSSALPAIEKEKVSNYDPNKKLYSRTNHDADKKAPTKKDRLNQSIEDDENARMRRPRKFKEKLKIELVVIDHAVMTTEAITIKDLSEKLGKPVADIVKKLFLMGIMATINNEIDYDTAALLAIEYGIELEYKLTKTYEDAMNDAADVADNDAEGNITRAPVVTIMGHVDHGKTSLLDAIRMTNVTAQEAGGITQHIGAYMVEHQGKTITFLDTPGHEAFTSMRARGAQVTDIAVLVVAADDGIMPQTIEAINHAKAAKVPIIIAINKMDKPNADAEKVKQELTMHEIVPEEWGGTAIVVPVSAVTKQGIDTLLEMILLVSEVEDFKANPDIMAKGTIVEAKLDKGRGPVATVLVQNGTLHIGDTIVAGTVFGRVRAMMNDKGDRVEAAGPSTPVEVLGFNDVPDAGDLLFATEDDKLSRQVAEERRAKIKSLQTKAKAKASLDDLFLQIKEGNIKELNVIIKADGQGSVEALKQAIEKLTTDDIRVRAIHGGVGAITGSDVMLAAASNAIVLGFNVRPDNMARTLAEQEKVDMRMYRVIYNAIEDIEAAMKGMRAPEFKEVILGHAEVRATFKVPSAGTIAGSYVTEGKILRNASVRLLRDNIVIHEGGIDSLKRFKDDAKEVATGFECGIGIANFNDIKEGDIIEAFIMEEIKKD